jgi:hypothetical protein
VSLRLARPLTLASATLAGGMRLLAAGGGLPQRLAEAADVFLPSVAGPASGVAWDPDGVHLWVSVQAANEVRKIHGTTGATVASYTTNGTGSGGGRSITAPRWISRRGNFIYFATSTGQYVGEIDTVSGNCELYASPLAGNVHAVSCVAGKAWIRSGPTTTGQYQEVSLSGTGGSATATATGRLSPAACWDCVADGVNLYFTDGTTITRYVEATAATTTLGSAGSNFNIPEYGVLRRGLLWNPIASRLIVQNGSDGWFVVNAAFTAAESRAFGYADMGGAPFSSSASLPTRASVAWSDDGTKIAFLTFESGAAATAMTSVRVVNLSTQTATWALGATGFDWTLRRASCPGRFANAKGGIADLPSSPSYASGVFDWERVKFHYRVNGGSWVQFDQGDSMAVAIAAAQTLDVMATIQRDIAALWGPPPFIGSVNGIGPTLDYERALPALGGLTC